MFLILQEKWHVHRIKNNMIHTLKRLPLIVVEYLLNLNTIYMYTSVLQAFSFIDNVFYGKSLWLPYFFNKSPQKLYLERYMNYIKLNILSMIYAGLNQFFCVLLMCVKNWICSLLQNVLNIWVIGSYTFICDFDFDSGNWLTNCQKAWHVYIKFLICTTYTSFVLQVEMAVF